MTFIEETTQLAREMSRNFKRNKLSDVAKKKDISEFATLDGALRAFESLSRPLEKATRLSVFEKTLKRKRLPPEEQVTPYTTQSAKTLGKLISQIPYVGSTKAASPVIIEEWPNS